MQITNDKGRTFTVRVVKEGDRYGNVERPLTHNKPEPMIEFYDAERAGKLGFNVEGQFVSRYNASSLAGIRHEHGLNLAGHEPEWSIDGKALAPVLLLARALLEGRAS